MHTPRRHGRSSGSRARRPAPSNAGVPGDHLRTRSNGGRSGACKRGGREGSTPRCASSNKRHRVQLPLRCHRRAGPAHARLPDHRDAASTCTCRSRCPASTRPSTAGSPSRSIDDPQGPLGLDFPEMPLLRGTRAARSTPGRMELALGAAAHPRRRRAQRGLAGRRVHAERSARTYRTTRWCASSAAARTRTCRRCWRKVRPRRRQDHLHPGMKGQRRAPPIPTSCSRAVRRDQSAARCAQVARNARPKRSTSRLARGRAATTSSASRAASTSWARRRSYLAELAELTKKITLPVGRRRRIA